MLNRETILVAVKLFLITALVALCLAVVNQVTAPAIAANTEKTFQEAQKKVLPEATQFVQDHTELEAETGVQINSLYIGSDDAGQTAGYVVSAVCSEGYGGDITVMTGVNADMTVHKVQVLEMSETPGLGARSQSEEFTNSYIGKTAGMTVVKSKTAGENEISAISGATITSKAVTKAVNASLNAVRQVVEQGSVEEQKEVQNTVREKEQETERQLSENPPAALEIPEEQPSAEETEGNAEPKAEAEPAEAEEEGEEE